MTIDQEIFDFKNYLIKNNISGLALDIDDTLAQTKKSLLNHLYKIIGNPENLSTVEFCQKYHLVQDAIYFQSPQALDLINKWAHSPEVFSDLETIDNSVSCVNQINIIMPIVAYITMRPRISTDITQIWLDQHNFPKARIISCPDSLLSYSAVEWKIAVLETLYPQVMGIVDDSISVAKNISSSYQGKIYLFNSDSCPTWDFVLGKIKS